MLRQICLDSFVLLAIAGWIIETWRTVKSCIHHQNADPTASAGNSEGPESGKES